MTPKQKKILKYVGFPLFYLVCLVIFVRLTFPYDTLRNRLVAEYNRSQPEKFLELDRLSGSGLFGVEAEGVRLLEVITTAEAAESGPPKMLVVESATVGVAALAYLFGSISVDFDAEVGGGTIEGSFHQSTADARIQVLGQEVDISGLTMLSAGIGLPLGGELGGKVELFLPERLMTKAEGTFQLAIVNFTAGDGKAKIRNTIALPKLNAGTLVLNAEATDGRLEIKEFSANGPDFQLDADGRVRLREPFDKSSVSVDATFKFKDAYTSKNDLTKSLFGSSDSKVPALFDMDPTVRRAKQPDGSYSWHVSGLLSKPSFGPARKRSAGEPAAD